MSKDALQSEHSCVIVGGLLWLAGGVSAGGEDGIMTALSHVLSMVGSRDKKSVFICG